MIPDVQAPGAAPMMTEEGDNALPVGTRLGEFEINGLIGQGGFGIVYRAYDHSLQRHVAIKEYMPSALAARTMQARVTVRSARDTDTFQAGLRSFVNEARLLAQFDHPSLVKVYRFWEDNGTAYMAMPLYHGETLKDVLRRRTAPPDEAWLKSLLAPLLDALDVIHRENCFHRDIAPDNILMLGDGHPLLLDFGAARRVIGGMTHAVTVIVKQGYAPIEQYAEIASMRQGAWTDIYALASVVHFAITGKPPAPAVERMIADPHVPLSNQAAGRYGDAFLKVIDQALSVKPEQRPQSVAQLRSMLDLDPATAQPPRPDRTAGSGGPGLSGVGTPGAEHTAPPPTASLLPGRAGAAAIVLVAIAIAIGVAVRTHFRTSHKVPEAAVIATRPLPQADRAPSAVPPAPAAATRDLAAPESPPAARPFDTLQMLDAIYEARDREHAVSVAVEKSQVRIGRDNVRFSVQSSRPGFVYLLMVGTDRSSLWLLFPNAIDKDNRIGANRPLPLPRKGWHMGAAGPPGTNRFVVMVSDVPRDFSGAGLQDGALFGEFKPSAAVLRPSDGSTIPVSAGKANCAAASQTPCSELFGAAAFSIREIARLQGR